MQRKEPRMTRSGSARTDATGRSGITSLLRSSCRHPSIPVRLSPRAASIGRDGLERGLHVVKCCGQLVRWRWPAVEAARGSPQLRETRLEGLRVEAPDGVSCQAINGLRHIVGMKRGGLQHLRGHLGLSGQSACVGGRGRPRHTEPRGLLQHIQKDFYGAGKGFDQLPLTRLKLGFQTTKVVVVIQVSTASAALECLVQLPLRIIDL
mmetsp:Transcript_74157/g.217619  ORF Transcript_74157/g.217619 Transcript_74157/m.217619 type:complete len:207 (-) Transcript_74157:553-1173(-)